MGKNEESKEVAKESLGVLSNILLAALTAVGTGGDPYVAGTSAFLGQFMSLRNKLKVNRVTNFVEELGEYIESIDRDLNWKNVDKNDFGDFFEMLLLKVSNTDSKTKIERFKKLLVNQINEPKSIDVIQRYLDLVSDLTENEVLILSHIYQFEEKWHQQNKVKSQLMAKLSGQAKSLRDKTINKPIKSIYDDPRLDRESQENLIKAIEIMGEIEVKRKNILETISYPEIEYSINVLQNKWLANNYRRQNPEAERLNIFAIYELTDFGNTFVEFLKEP